MNTNNESIMRARDLIRRIREEEDSVERIIWKTELEDRLDRAVRKNRSTEEIAQIMLDMLKVGPLVSYDDEVIGDAVALLKERGDW